jgi:hypothetical protein
LTAGRWSWKLICAKKCVIAFLPNGLAVIMEGAHTVYLSLASVAVAL